MADRSRDTAGKSRGETGDYSATKAPENREHVESEHAPTDATLQPGGSSGADVPVGMSALDRATVPDEASSTAHTGSSEELANNRGGPTQR
jgi:hypothetical protein